MSFQIAKGRDGRLGPFGRGNPMSEPRAQRLRTTPTFWDVRLLWEAGKGSEH